MSDVQSGSRWSCSGEPDSRSQAEDWNHPDGLAVLSAHRPDIIQVVFDLRASLGESLSPMTRELIRIALHVTHGRLRSLRCSVPRALAEGATPDQVIDTVLLLVPEIGLSPVTDALNVVSDFVKAVPGK